jgi:endonuclease/exonuclease/phosphatase family metal-dependent hydrolase
MCVQFQHGEAAAQLTAMGFSEAEVRAVVSSVCRPFARPFRPGIHLCDPCFSRSLQRPGQARRALDVTQGRLDAATHLLLDGHLPANAHPTPTPTVPPQMQTQVAVEESSSSSTGATPLSGGVNHTASAAPTNAASDSSNTLAQIRREQATRFQRHQSARGRQPRQQPAQEHAADVSELRLLSYNCWFNEEVKATDRMAAIASIVRQQRPHVVALQELTPNLLRLLRPALEAQGFRFAVETELPSCPWCGSRYFVALASRLPMCGARFSPFEVTEMGRGLLSAVITPTDQRGHTLSGGGGGGGGNSWKVVVSTAHLESTETAKSQSTRSRARKAQLAASITELEAAVRCEGSADVSAVLMGDLNWKEQCDGEAETILQQCGGGSAGANASWIDCWPALKGSAPGYTYDGPANAMLLNRYKSRFDRILVKGRSHWQPQSVQLLGTEPIVVNGTQLTYRHKNGRTLPVLPSDHFGIFAALTLRHGADEQPRLRGESKIEASHSQHAGDGSDAAASATSGGIASITPSVMHNPWKVGGGAASAPHSRKQRRGRGGLHHVRRRDGGGGGGRGNGNRHDAGGTTIRWRKGHTAFGDVAQFCRDWPPSQTVNAAGGWLWAENEDVSKQVDTWLPTLLAHDQQRSNEEILAPLLDANRPQNSKGGAKSRSKKEKRGVVASLLRRNRVEEDSGKFLFNSIKSSCVDEVWQAVVTALSNGQLGRSAKVADATPGMSTQSERVICVYVNIWDPEEVRRVCRTMFLLNSSLQRLEGAPNYFKSCNGKIKPDLFTRLGIMAGNPYKLDVTLACFLSDSGFDEQEGERQLDAIEDSVTRTGGGTNSAQGIKDTPHDTATADTNFVAPRVGCYYIPAEVVGLAHHKKEWISPPPKNGDTLLFVRDQANIYDPNAIKVVLDAGVHLGHLPRKMAAVLGPALDNGIVSSISLDVGGDVNPPMLRLLHSMRTKVEKPRSSLSVMLVIRLADGASQEAKASLDQQMRQLQ